MVPWASTTMTRLLEAYSSPCLPAALRDDQQSRTGVHKTGVAGHGHAATVGTEQNKVERGHSWVEACGARALEGSYVLH